MCVCPSLCVVHVRFTPAVCLMCSCVYGSVMCVVVVVCVVSCVYDI